MTSSDTTKRISSKWPARTSKSKLQRKKLALITGLVGLGSKNLPVECMGTVPSSATGSRRHPATHVTRRIACPAGSRFTRSGGSVSGPSDRRQSTLAVRGPLRRRRLLDRGRGHLHRWNHTPAVLCPRLRRRRRRRLWNLVPLALHSAMMSECCFQSPCLPGRTGVHSMSALIRPSKIHRLTVSSVRS